MMLMPPGWSPENVGSDVLAEYELKDEVHVEVEWIGEGYSGDYVPSDPDDVPFVRFTAADLTGRGRDSQDVSYCTLVPAYAPRVAHRLLAQRLALRLAPLAEWSRSCEAWSTATVGTDGRLIAPVEAAFWRKV
jgi:hypothetical protein